MPSQADDVKDIISDKNFWSKLSVVVKTLNVAVMALRISDGIAGGVMGKLFDLCLQLDALYSAPINGLDEEICEKKPEDLSGTVAESIMIEDE